MALKHFIDEAIESARKSELADLEEQWLEHDQAWGVATNYVVDVTEYLYGVSWAGHRARIYALIRDPRDRGLNQVVITLLTDKEYDAAITSGRWRPMDHDFDAAEQMMRARRANERPAGALPEQAYAHEPVDAVGDTVYLLKYDSGDKTVCKEIHAGLAREEIQALIYTGIAYESISVWQPVEVEIEVQVAVKIGGKP
jgi:hypothetical protein